jgi:hypothetical protein
MGRLVHYGPKCDFCGFQSSTGEGFMAPSGVTRKMYRCPEQDCGAVICECDMECEKTMSRIKLVIGVLTCGISVLLFGLYDRKYRCLRCNSERIKELNIVR